jgi:capsular polysaccharide biosynthesis protein
MDEDQKKYYEDEIELMDYLLVIWKWKYVIIVGTLAFGFAAAIISFIALNQQPTMYRTSIVFKPGILKIDDKGEKVFIDTPENIKTLIENNLKFSILEQVEKLNNTKLSTAIDFQVDISKGSDIINVSLESASKDEGTTKLNYLIKVLISKLNYKFSHILKSVDEQREQIKSTLAQLKGKEVIERKKIKNGIERKKNELDELLFKENIIKYKIEKYQKELSDIEAKIKFLQDNKDISQNKEYIIAKLSLENDYRNTFQTYFELNENAKFNLFGLQKKISSVANEIKDLKKTKDNIKIDPFLQPDLYEIQTNIIKFTKDIEILEKEKRNIQVIQIIRPLVTMRLPKTIKTKRNVTLSLAMGLFMMTFTAFFLEYLSNYKKRGRDLV